MQAGLSPLLETVSQANAKHARKFVPAFYLLRFG